MTTTLTEPEAPEKKGLFGAKKKKDDGEPDLPDFSAFSAVKPKPNLVPRYVRERRAADRTMRITFYAIIALVALLVGGVIAGFFYAQGEKSKLDDTLSTQTQVQNEVTRLQPIADYYDGLVQRQELASSTMQNDLDHPRLLDGLYAAARGNATITAVTLAPSAPCPGPNPFEAISALGCINITAEATSPAGAADFVEALNSNEELFSGAFTPSFAGGEGATTSVTVNYDADALSMRFVPEERRAEVKAAVEAAAAAGASGTTGATPPATPPAPTGATP